MKQIFKSMLLLAATATAFTACNKEVDTQEPEKVSGKKSFQFSAVVDETETRATLTTEDESSFTAAWETGDMMEIHATNTVGYDEFGSATWTGSYFDTSEFEDCEDQSDWEYFAYYPLHESNIFQSARTQNGSNYNSEYDIMIGEIAYQNALLGEDPDGGHMVIPMRRLTSIAYFHLTSDLNEELSSATLSVDGDNAIASDLVEIEDNALVPNEFAGGLSNSITITFEEGTAPNAQNFRLWFNILPVQTSGLTLTITTVSGKTATLRNTKGKTYVAGKVNKVVKSGLTWKKNVDKYYVKVTPSDDLGNGQYLIVYESGSVAFNGGLETLDATSNNIGVEITNNGILSSTQTDAASFTISVGSESSTIKSASGYYIGQTSNSNGLQQDETTGISNSISIDNNGNAVIVSGGAYLRYNKTSGQERFRYFKSSSYTGQQAVALYKLTAGAPDSRTPVTLTFTPAETEAITLGDDFTEPTLTVNPVEAASLVTYSVSTAPDGIASVVSNGELTITGAGTITVTASIADGNATYKPASASYTLTVNPVATIDFQTIAELNALIAKDKPSESNPATYSGKLTNAVVSYVPTTKNAIIKDATGSVLVYNNDGHNLIQGQTFTGDMTVTAILYRNCSEILAIDAAFVGDGAVVNPEVVTLEDLVGHLETYQNAYVQLSGLTVTAVDGKNVTVTDDEDRTYIVYSSAANASCVVGDVITVVGTVAWYNDKDQVKAWKATDITVTYHPVASRTITFTQPSQSGCSIVVSVDGSSITSGDGVPEGKTVTIAATGTNDYVFTKWTVTGATVANATAATTTFVVGSNNVTISAEFSDPNKDVLNFDFTGNTGTSYSSWSNKTGVSGAVYAGQSGGSYSSIQLRSDNNNSGIITTSSSKYAKKVTVTWNSNSPKGRTLQVYGKNTAYSAPTDLYGSNAGALIGTIVCGTSTELTINYDYKYIGLRSSSGAIYLDEIQIDWSASASGNVQKFDVVVADSQNGEVTAQPSEDIEPGNQVVLIISPDDGYELNALIVDGNNVTSAVSNGTYTFNMPYHDVDVSAAFAVVQTGEESQAQFVFNTDEGLSALGIAKPATGGSTDLVGPYALDGVTLSVTHASTKTRVYNSSGTLDLRVYKSGGSLSFAVENGKKIISIEITGTAPFSANVGTFSNGNWTGSAQSVTLSATGTARINTITVTYK